MPLDELVFTREALRRELVAAAELAEQVTNDYDPEEDIPVQDLALAIMLSAVQQKITQYTLALRARSEVRKDLGSS